MTAWNDSYQWHFDYVRLAWDTSFNFEKQKTGNLDRSKICLIDIDRIIDQRDFASVDRYLPSVVNYTLESEQAAVLDDNFVKIFRMSQLASQYLLFCKKYLDNTVVLLKSELTKLKEENSELKVFNEELKEHVSTLVRKLKLQKNQDNSSLHKCEKCMKVFSNEHYLNSHMKRRHGQGYSEHDDTSVNTEADKLQSEIKMLKERLNSTERLIQQEQKPSTQTLESKESELRILELQQKFEMWKMQVDGELKLIQTQKNVEEKYEKWFANVFEKLKETLESSSGKETKEVDTMAQDIHSNETAVLRRDSVTQTDDLAPRKIEEATMTMALIEEEKESKADEAVLPIIKGEITKFEEAVNEKVTSSFHKIETQLDSFWNKLNKLEEMRNTLIHLETVPNQASGTASTQPAIKPRTKYQQKNEQPLQTNVIMVQSSPKKSQNSPSLSEHDNQVHGLHGNEQTLEGDLKIRKRSSDEEDVINRHAVDAKTKIMKSEIEKYPQENNGKDSQPKRYNNILVHQQMRKKVVDPKIPSQNKVKNLRNMKEAVSLNEDSESSDSDSSESSSDSSDSESDLPEQKHYRKIDTPRVKVDTKKSSPARKPPEKHQAIRHPRAVLSPTKKISKKSVTEKPQLEKVRHEIDLGVNKRLQIIGVSPDWKGLPEKSFKKAMEIISHQAFLAEKNFIGYQKVRKHVLQKVGRVFEEKKINSSSRKNNQQKMNSEKKASKMKKKEKPVLEKITIENRVKNRSTPSPKHILIQSPKSSSHKPRIEESDTEESTSLKDHHFGDQKMASRQSLKKYSEVIKELKMKSSGILSSDDNSPEPDINVEMKNNAQEDKHEEIQTKSALKNYPSIGSLSKKKVLFDLDSDSNNVDDKLLVHNLKDGGGSTTSVGSSVLDGTPRTLVKNDDVQKTKQQNEIEDLSDFDF